MSAEATARLAYYSDGAGLSVLAPRGWHCFELYGSDGAFLVVSPEPVSTDIILAARRPHGFTHPVVVLSSINGFTSGRDEVAPIINHVFPKHRDFVKSAAENMDQRVPSYQGPFRGDKLHYRSPETVEYTTPAHREGLGTQNFLRPAALGITGVDMLVQDDGDCCDLISLAIRLPAKDWMLSKVIIQQAERESQPRSSVPYDSREPPVR